MRRLVLLALLPICAAASTPTSTATPKAEADSYAEARRTTAETGRPMVVLVGAKWCPACVEMKQNVVPKVRGRGALKRVAFAVVDLDRERRLGQDLTEGGPIPQLIMFRKTPDGWRRRTLVGGQKPETIERFIKQGVELDEAVKQSDQARATKDAPKSTL